MMKKLLVFLGAMLLGIGITGIANTTLTRIGTAIYQGTKYNLIYEDDCIYGGLVWLDYRQILDFRGNQMNWAAGLDAAGVLNYHFNPGIIVTWNYDWRLPSVGDNPENGFNQTTSEMGHLYYDSLNNPAGYSSLNKGPFENLQPGGNTLRV
jgi:hypothetical protein